MCERTFLRVVWLVLGSAFIFHAGRIVCAQTNAASVRRPRPAADAQLHVEAVSPELDAILKKWEQASGRIQSLQGKHYRWVYDLVFNIEKRSQGVFYYRAPDKGRIDFKGRKPAPGEVSRRIDPKTGKPFEIRPDHDEIWICDGTAIWQINEKQKTAERFEIPPEHRGRNIMDGPLPFLFGMPAEKAKKRYSFKLLKETDTEIWLQVTPRWQQDAANYRQAYIILDKGTYLPKAVRLIDPAGTKETVFRFEDLKVNPKENIFHKLLPGRDPFHPNLRGYRIATRSVQPRKTANGQQTVPSVVGFNWQQATTLLKQCGYVVKCQRGIPANRKELVYVVYKQEPAPRTPLPKGSVVVLTLYDKLPEQSDAQSR